MSSEHSPVAAIPDRQPRPEKTTAKGFIAIAESQRRTWTSVAKKPCSLNSVQAKLIGDPSTKRTR